MRLMIDLMSRLNRLISNIGVVIACGLLVLMTSAVILQVASRELRNPIGWTEEVALASMVWVAFLVGPWAYRNHEFTRIDVVIEAMPLRTRSILQVFIHLFEAAITVGATYYSWRFFLGGNSILPQMTHLMRDLLAPFTSSDAVKALAVKNKYVYVILPAGFTGLFLVSVEHVLRAIQTLRTGEEHRVGFHLKGVEHTPDTPEVIQRQTDNDQDYVER